jgi:hypothetical protein
MFGFTSDRVYMAPLLQLKINGEMVRRLYFPPLLPSVLSQRVPE